MAFCQFFLSFKNIQMTLMKTRLYINLIGNKILEKRIFTTPNFANVNQWRS